MIAGCGSLTINNVVWSVLTLGGEMPTISKRKLESYKRAEKVAQEARRQCSAAYKSDPNKLCEFVIHWMQVTGKVKYETPNLPSKRVKHEML